MYIYIIIYMYTYIYIYIYTYNGLTRVQGRCWILTGAVAARPYTHRGKHQPEGNPILGLRVEGALQLLSNRSK